MMVIMRWILNIPKTISVLIITSNVMTSCRFFQFPFPVPLLDLCPSFGTAFSNGAPVPPTSWTGITSSRLSLVPFLVPQFNLCPSLSTPFPNWTPISPSPRASASSTSSSRTSASRSPAPIMEVVVTSSSRKTTATTWTVPITGMPRRTTTSTSTTAMPSLAPPKQLTFQIAKTEQVEKGKMIEI